MTYQNELIPIVPYESDDEYRQLLNNLEIDYKQMVETGLNMANLSLWCTHYRGVSAHAQYHWSEHGKNLFLKFTKGKGVEWCEMMNDSLVSLLDTSVRVCIKTHELLEGPMSGDETDKMILSRVLETEVSETAENITLSPYYDKNFEAIYISSRGDDLYYIPIQKFQELQLSFVMGLHSRLGQNSPAQGLSSEIVQLIFSEKMMLD